MATFTHFFDGGAPHVDVPDSPDAGPTPPSSPLPELPESPDPGPSQPLEPPARYADDPRLHTMLFNRYYTTPRPRHWNDEHWRQHYIDNSLEYQMQQGKLTKDEAEWIMYYLNEDLKNVREDTSFVGASTTRNRIEDLPEMLAERKRKAKKAIIALFNEFNEGREQKVKIPQHMMHESNTYE